MRLSAFTVAAPLSGPIAIAWPGKPFEAPAAPLALWIECRLFPAEPRGFGLTGPDAIRRGYMQAECITRIRDGSYDQAVLDEVTQLADQVAAHFPEAAWYSHDGIRVQIAEPPGPQTQYEEDGKLKMPVVIRYQAFE